MTPAHEGSGTPQVAVLTVKLAPAVVEQIRRCAAELPWALIPVDFENYFSIGNRPPLTQRAIDADACIAIIDFDQDCELALATAEFLRQSFYHKIAIMACS